MIHFRYQSGVFTLETEQHLPITMQQAWHFFSNPYNLKQITPAEMGFQVTSTNDNEIYPGQIITYQVGIFPLIKSNWVTEITHVAAPAYFVDEQRFGPYRMWHHEHHFQQTANGVVMKDKVTYKLPMGILGRWVHQLFVKQKLLAIFVFRQEILEKTLP